MNDDETIEPNHFRHISGVMAFTAYWSDQQMPYKTGFYSKEPFGDNTAMKLDAQLVLQLSKQLNMRTNSPWHLYPDPGNMAWVLFYSADDQLSIFEEVLAKHGREESRYTVNIRQPNSEKT